jgi:hypothetical protein
MRYFIYHPTPGPTRRAEVECKTYAEAKATYLRLQDIYPSREMALYVVNDWGEKSTIHTGRWTEK